MIPHHFTGQTTVFEAARDYDHEAHGECVGLPVRVIGAPGQARTFLSVWKPTPEELAELSAGGAVTISVLGSQPPIMLGTCPADSLLVPA